MALANTVLKYLLELPILPTALALLFTNEPMDTAPVPTVKFPPVIVPVTLNEVNVPTPVASTPVNADPLPMKKLALKLPVAVLNAIVLAVFADAGVFVLSKL